MNKYSSWMSDTPAVIARRRPDRYAHLAEKIARKHAKDTDVVKRRLPYHYLDLRDPHFGHGGGWRDRSELVLIAPFRVLCEFMEREEYSDGGVGCDWRATAGHWAAKKEIDRLYVWWTTERPAEHEAAARMLDGVHRARRRKGGDSSRPGVAGGFAQPTPAQQKKNLVIYRRYWKEEERLWEKDATMAARLIRVRGCLWT